ncbi:MAG: glycosyltransferase family 2 protein [Chloroflexota bacterium]|nr:glycosyltransferase family 2 protein [Chloroflexota bacterium]
MAPSVYVLILNYNGIDHLSYCLSSVLETEYPQLYIVLIDNGSDDDSVTFTRNNYPQIEIIKNNHNLGWAAGNNVGIRCALERGADYVVLLNNDMRVDSRWLTHAVAAAEADPLIGFVGFDTIGEYHLNADPDLTQFRQRQSAWQRLEVTEAEHIAGCALFLQADLLRNIGLLDEHFFAYGEEDDLQKRARRAGYRSVRINIPLWHYNSGSFGKRTLKTAMLAQRNHIRVMIKADLPRVALRRFRDMVMFICWPGVQYDHNLAHLRRLRPSVYPINTFILLYAIVWNLVMLPTTLIARHRDEQSIRKTHQRLAALQTQGDL